MKRCDQCSHAAWGTLTPTGRVGRGTIGYCRAPADIPSSLPASVKIKVERSHVWPDFGADCAFFKSRGTEPRHCMWPVKR